MYAPLRQAHSETLTSNDNYCSPGLSVSACGRQDDGGIWGETGGCVFQVGKDLYFVPTKQVSGDDVLYITCDAQKIEGPLDGWRSLPLGDKARDEVEDAILQHLSTSPAQKTSESFVVTRNGKTFRL